MAEAEQQQVPEQPKAAPAVAKVKDKEVIGKKIKFSIFVRLSSAWMISPRHPCFPLRAHG